MKLPIGTIIRFKDNNSSSKCQVGVIIECDNTNDLYVVEKLGYLAGSKAKVSPKEVLHEMLAPDDDEPLHLDVKRSGMKDSWNVSNYANLVKESFTEHFKNIWEMSCKKKIIEYLYLMQDHTYAVFKDSRAASLIFEFINSR